jgi:hypothetical protein
MRFIAVSPLFVRGDFVSVAKSGMSMSANHTQPAAQSRRKHGILPFELHVRS